MSDNRCQDSTSYEGERGKPLILAVACNRSSREAGEGRQKSQMELHREQLGPRASEGVGQVSIFCLKIGEDSRLISVGR